MHGIKKQNIYGLNEIYEIYLEDLKLWVLLKYMQPKQERAIQESSENYLTSKVIYLEISIDSDYLNKLKEIKLDPSDKAEK